MGDKTNGGPGHGENERDELAAEASSPAADNDEEGVPRTIHDAFFKELFGDLENAASVLRAITPAMITAHLDWTSLQPTHASVVHKQYRQTHGDLMFEARWHRETVTGAGQESDGDTYDDINAETDAEGDSSSAPSGEQLDEDSGDDVPVFLHVHIEHQSRVDRWMALRGLDMANGLWRQWRSRHSEAKYLPAVLTYVFYHGAGRWSGPRSLHELIAMPEAVREELQQYGPAFRFVLDDLRSTSDEELSQRNIAPYPKLALVLMKHGSARDVAEQLAHHYIDDLTALLGQSEGGMLLRELLDYLWHVNEEASVRRVLAVLPPHVGAELEKVVIPYAEKLRQEGHKEGHKLGLEDGRKLGLEDGRKLGLEDGRKLGLEDGRKLGLEDGHKLGHKLGLEDGRKLGLEDGQRQMLIHLLESRFGPLPDAILRRLEQATNEETKRWAVRVLDAGSLEEIFSAA